MIFINSNLKINTFGGTHEKEIGGLIMGFPTGVSFEMDDIFELLERRRPAGLEITTKRDEPDLPIVTSGLAKLDETGQMITNGDPIRVVFENKDVKDAENDEDFIPRPGHGDYTYYKNTGKFLKGATSARSTAPVVFAGALCKEYLKGRGIFVSARMTSPEKDEIKKAQAEGDSIGGIVSCTIIGLPAGFGNPFAEKVESTISACIFNIPGVKGLEFGRGFELEGMFGSEANDEFYFDDNGEVRTKTNNCGGLLGGMASGSPVEFSVAFKPTPSIKKEQNTVNLKTGENVTIKCENRSDPCIAVRGAAVVEAAACIALTDICMRDFSRTLGGPHANCSACKYLSAIEEIEKAMEEE